MNKIIFEDSEYAPSSQLLKASKNGSNIHFANGGNSSNILAAINKYRTEDPDCTMIVYFDLPPNNKNAYVNYERLVTTLAEENYLNIYVRFIDFLQKILYPCFSQKLRK